MGRSVLVDGRFSERVVEAELLQLADDPAAALFDAVGNVGHGGVKGRADFHAKVGMHVDTQCLAGRAGEGILVGLVAVAEARHQLRFFLASSRACCRKASSSNLGRW